MKKLYFLLIILTATIAGWSQNTYTWKNINSGSWQVPTNWEPARTTPASSDRLIFNNTVTVNNVPTQTIGRLTVEAGFTVNLFPSNPANVLTISNTTAPAFVVNGDLVSDVSITLGDNVDAGISGTFTINSGRTFNTQGPNNNGNRPTTTVSTGGIIENRGNIVSLNSNRLLFESGSTYIHNRDGGDIPFADWDNNSNCNITGVIATMPTMTSFDQEFGNFKWDAQGQTGNLSFIGNLREIDGNFIVANTGNSGAINLAISGANFTVTVGGDYVQTGGILNMIGTSGSCDLELMGNFNMSGGTLRRGGGTCNFIFDRNGAQTFVKTAGIIEGSVNFSIDNNSQVDFGTSVLNGLSATFNLNSQGKIVTSHAGGLSSTGATGSIQVGGARTFSNNADYEFRGGSTGSFTTTGNQVRDLIINNATTNEVVAARNFIVTRVLTLTNGYLTTTAGQVTIGTAGNASTSNGAFVNGPLSKNTNSNASFTFPVGKVDGGLRTIGITTTSNNASTFTAQFFRAAPAAGVLGAGIAKVSGCEYWDLARPSGTAPVRVVLSWASGSACNGAYITDPTALRVAHLLAGTWVNEGRQSSTGDNTAGTITSSVAVNSFSPFALASSSIDANPLPVVFGDVKAYERNGGVQVEWSNLTEKDVADYTVERSTDGRSFSGIAGQLPTSNQNDRADYASFDANPSQGTNYYRIKAVETTGKIVYSKVLSVNLGQSNTGLKLYPNPVSGNEVTISLSNVSRGQYNLRVVNAAGQDIYKQAISTQGSTTTQTIDLPASIKPGVYSMIITGGNYRENKMFIVQ